MIIINGKVTGQINSNGRVITNNHEETKTVDITKTELAYSTLNLSISSQLANVNISTWDNDNVQARLHGNISKEQNISLNISKAYKNIKISVDVNSFSNSFCMVNNLELDIQVPLKLFEEVIIKSNNGNISLKSLNASVVDASCTNGNISCCVLPKHLSLSSNNGNLQLNAKAVQDSVLDLNSKNGNISAKLNNISHSTVDVFSKNGNHTMSCSHSKAGLYAISGNVSTKNGNVSFEY